MDRIALFAAGFISLALALNGSLTTPALAARKGYSARLGLALGLSAGLLGSVLGAVASAALWPDRSGLLVAGSLLGGLGALAAVWSRLPDRARRDAPLPEGEALRRNIQARHLRGTIARTLYLGAIVIALVALATLLWTIANKSFGLVAVQYDVEPDALLLNGEPTGRPLDELSEHELEQILAQNVREALLRRFILESVLAAPQADWPQLSPAPVAEALAGRAYPEDLADRPLNELTSAEAAHLINANMDRDDLEELIFERVINPTIVASWPLWDALMRRDEINTRAAESYPQAELQWRSWISRDFLSGALDPRRADVTGVRPAIIGSLLVILIAIAFAFPVGVGAALYLEEYARDNTFNRIIQTNISNLAGVPSIIYGMLGLAIFVRALEPLTSGQAFGASTANGRTVLSAGLTLALLILPLIIINAQEAVRAVPNSLRQASYGLGATQWQTIWHHVLPYAMPGILTGTILSVSRAFGETAPLILVGGATYLTRDPDGPFSIFTALPLIIFRWTTLPQDEFRNAAAAAIVVLLVLLLTMNSFAIILRNRLSRRLIS